jgi:RNA-directed DNA polymerase
MLAAWTSRAHSTSAALPRKVQYAVGVGHEQHSSAEPSPLWSSVSCAINVLLLEAQIKQRVSGSPSRNYPFELKITFCVRGVISPLLANLFLHYGLDRWLSANYPLVLFERYADDVIVHRRTEKQAQEMRQVIADRLRVCGLELHPEKTKIIYCKDDLRKKTYPNEKFDFLGYTFRPRESRTRKGRFFINFSPGVSNKSAKAIRDTIRSWKLQRRSGAAIEDLAREYNPIIRGWLQYYGRYYRTALYPTMHELDRDLALWAKRKYKTLRRHLRRAKHWIARIKRRVPALFAHWQMGTQRGSMMGAV